MVVHLETERSDLRDEVLVGNPHLFCNLIHSHLRSGHPCLATGGVARRCEPCALIRGGVSTGFAPARPGAFFPRSSLPSPPPDELSPGRDMPRTVVTIRSTSSRVTARLRARAR